MKKAFLIILILAVATSMVLVACKSSDKPASGEWQGPAGEGQEEPQGEIVPQDNVQGPLTEADWIAALDCSTFPFRAEAICYKEDVEDVSLRKQIVCDYARNLCYEKSGEDEKIYAHIGGDYWLYTKESDPNALYPWVRSSNYSAVTGIFDYIPLVTLSRLFDRFRYQPSTGTYEGEDISIYSSSDGMYTDVSVITWRGDFSVLVEDGKLVRLVFKSYGQYYSSDNASRWEFSFSYDDVEITLPERFAETHRVTIAAAGTWYTINAQSFALNDNHPTFEIADQGTIRIDGMSDVRLDALVTPLHLGYRVQGWYKDGEPITGPVTVDEDIAINVVFVPVAEREDNGAVHTVSSEEWAAIDLRSRQVKVQKVEIDSEGVHEQSVKLCDYEGGLVAVREDGYQKLYARIGEEYWLYTTPLDASGEPDFSQVTRRSAINENTFESLFNTFNGRIEYRLYAYHEASGNYYRADDEGLFYYSNYHLLRFDDGRLVEYGNAVYGGGKVEYYTYTYEDAVIQVPQEYAVEYLVTVVPTGTAGREDTMTFAVYSDHPTFGVDDSDRLRITSEDRRMSLNNVLIALDRGYKIEGWYIDGARVTFPMTIDGDVTLVARLVPLDEYQDRYTVLPEQWAEEFEFNVEMTDNVTIDFYMPAEEGYIKDERHIVTRYDGQGGAWRLSVTRDGLATTIKEECGVSRPNYNASYRSREDYLWGDLSTSTMDESIYWRNNYPTNYISGTEQNEYSLWRSLYAHDRLNLRSLFLSATFDKEAHRYVILNHKVYGKVVYSSIYVYFEDRKLTAVEFTFVSGRQGYVRYTYGGVTVEMPDEEACRPYYLVNFSAVHGTTTLSGWWIQEGVTVAVSPDDPLTLVWPHGRVGVTFDEGYEYVGWYDADNLPIDSVEVGGKLTITARSALTDLDKVLPDIPTGEGLNGEQVSRQQWEDAFVATPSNLVEDTWQWATYDYDEDGEEEVRYAVRRTTFFDYEEGLLEVVLLDDRPGGKFSYDIVITGETYTRKDVTYHDMIVHSGSGYPSRITPHDYEVAFDMDDLCLRHAYESFIFNVDGYYEGRIHNPIVGAETTVKVWFVQGQLRRIEYARDGEQGIFVYRYKDVAIVGYHEAVLYGALD